MLYEVTATGRLLRTVPIAGAEAIDWEDVAPDGHGGVWIGDIGNNANRRRNLTLYHVSGEALAADGEVRPKRVLRYAYPEQTAFPMPLERNFDAEALFVDHGVPHVLTKHRSDSRTVLYRIEAGPEGEEAVAVRLGDFDVGGEDRRFGGMVTSADLHPSGDWLAVLTYHALFIFERPVGEGEHWLSRPVSEISLVQDAVRQCEAISWDGSGLLMTNEDGVIFRIEDPLAPDRWFPEGVGADASEPAG